MVETTTKLTSYIEYIFDIWMFSSMQINLKLTNNPYIKFKRAETGGILVKAQKKKTISKTKGLVPRVENSDRYPIGRFP
jgi:hypothetical protein